jgi:hypothetical protein
LHPRPRRHVRLPAVPGAPRRRDHPAADDEEAQIGAAVRHELLDVEDGALHFEGPEGPVGQVLVADAHDAAAAGSEKRLDQNVAHAAERLHGVVEGLGGDRARRRDPGLAQKTRGPVLVHRALDGPGRVHDRQPGVVEDVQEVHAEDDLIERPGWDEADQKRVERLQRAAF